MGSVAIIAFFYFWTPTYYVYCLVCYANLKASQLGTFERLYKIPLPYGYGDKKKKKSFSLCVFFLKVKKDLLAISRDYIKRFASQPPLKGAHITKL